MDKKENRSVLGLFPYRQARMMKFPQNRNTMAPEPLKRRLVDIHQAAEYLNLSVNTMYKFVSQRRIPYIKVGRLLRFDIGLLDDWVMRQTVMPRPLKARL